MNRASILRRRLVLVLGIPFVLLASLPAWHSWQDFSRMRHARRSLSQGNPKAAIVPLEELAAASPDRVDVQYLLGVAQRRAGNVNDAKPFLERARELGWPEEDVARQERLLIVQTGQTQWAESLLQEAIQKETPDDVAEEIYEALSIGYSMAYDLLAAQRCLDYWLAWKPDAVAPRMLKAGLAKRAGVSLEAISEYEKILTIEPEHAEAHLEYARMLLQGNRIPEAFAHFKYCVEVDESDLVARLGLAECYSRMGQSAEARAALEYALERSDSERHRAVAMIELAKLAIAESKYEEAVANLREAERIEPADANIHYLLGTALAKLRRVEDARAAFARSKELRAKFDRIADLHELLLADPAMCDERFEVGAILMEVGKESQAVGWWRTVFLHDPNHRRTHEALLAYYERKGLTEHAAAHREALASLDREGTAQPAGDAPGAGGPVRPIGSGSPPIQAAPTALPNAGP